MKISGLFGKKELLPPDISLLDMSDAVAKWSAMYENRSGNGSLNIAAGICSELARLVTVELSSQISGGSRAEYLNRQYERVIERARAFVEYACAQGGVVLKPYLENGEIRVSTVLADSFCPTEYTSDGEICGGVFLEEISGDGFYYTRREEHRMKNGRCIIKNTAYKSRAKNIPGREIRLSEVEEWKSIEPYCVIENVARPLFVYFKMPMANSVCPGSPLGVSAFARAVDLIEDANTQYNNLLWEFESGKRALYLDECAIRRDEDNNMSLPDKRLYKMLSTGDDSLFEDWSPIIRESEYLKGLDRILKSIEFNCGLAYGTVSDPESTEKTAEEIKASRQRSYATVCDIQGSLKKALCELAEVFDIYCDIYELAPRGKYSVSFNFDDSIVCDRGKEFSERITLLEKGVVAPWELRQWYFGEDEERAKSRIGEINEICVGNSMAQNAE